MNNTPKSKCPVCRTSTVQGYLIRGTAIKRCETCEGHGVVTDMQVMAWELSL